MGYGTYLLKRVINSLMVLVLVTLITTILFTSVMDAEARARIEEQIRQEFARLPPEQRAELLRNQTKYRLWYEGKKRFYEIQYGLDKPFWYRVLKRTMEALMFSFGESTSVTGWNGERDVATIILQRLPNTILLFTSATIIVTIIGLYLGLKAARNAGKLLDKVTSIYALLSNSVPMWWVGMIMILVFSYRLKIFPSGGIQSIPPPPPGLPTVLDYLYHLALPLITVIIVSIGGWAYVVRNVVIDIMHEDFVLVARAKGLPESIVLYRHVLRAAAPPIVTIIVLSLIGSLGGAIITETVFKWPGMGMLYWTAIEQQDIPVIIGQTYVFIFLYVLAFLILDIIYGILDPRVRVR